MIHWKAPAIIQLNSEGDERTLAFPFDKVGWRHGGILRRIYPYTVPFSPTEIQKASGADPLFGYLCAPSDRTIKPA
jgi:hypothetical protein